MEEERTDLVPNFRIKEETNITNSKLIEIKEKRRELVQKNVRSKKSLLVRYSRPKRVGWMYRPKVAQA